MRFSQWHAATCRSGRLGFSHEGLLILDSMGFMTFYRQVDLIVARTCLWFSVPVLLIGTLLWFLWLSGGSTIMRNCQSG